MSGLRPCRLRQTWSSTPSQLFIKIIFRGWRSYRKGNKTMRARILLTAVAVLMLHVAAFGQNSRAYIRNQIEKWGSCRNVAVTLTGGDLALNYNNAYAYSGIPSNLANAIKSLHDDSEFIDDVQLTEAGRWLVLYGNNGLRWYNIPSDLERQLRKYNDRGDVITSVTFNDKGGWIIISSEYITASNSEVNGWIKEGIEEYGQLWAAHMTNDGLALCYERGYKFMGNVPETLKNKLRETKIDVFRIKFLSDGTYFIADKDGNYSYYM